MPYLTVVLPCHNVQAYLRQCLDSILAASGDDLEVIGIDDASPDHSGEILDEYAARDPRLHVVHLEQNVGLGEARNVGLERASGDYVMFVDSDDYLAPDGVEASIARLRETSPDILFFDYQRVHASGVSRTKHELFHDGYTADVFTLRDRPKALNLMMATWDRVYRRSFLVELGQRFARGYYEDIPVTFPALMVARRIALLNHVVYFYRQRGSGAITKTRSRKHFDVFEQYERVFAFMDANLEATEGFRAAMVRRMLGHCYLILERGDRVPSEDRKEFFARMADLYRRHLPEGERVPEGRDGRKERFVASGSFRGYEAGRALARARRSVRSRRSGVRSLARSLRHAVGRRVRAVQYRIHLRRPLDPNLAVFAAYWNRQPACNPLAIYEALVWLAPHIRATWIVSAAEKGQVPEDIPFVIEGSAEYYRVLARATYLVNNVNFPNFVVKRTGSVHLQTQHGTPLKTMGLDLQRFPVAGKGMKFTLLAKRASRWDFNISSNRHSSEVWERAYPSRFVDLEYGYPRNDRYYNADAAEVRRIRAELGLKPGSTAILYAPTHREYRSSYEPQLDIARLARSLPSDHVLLVRAHYFYDDLRALRELQRAGVVADVSRHPSTEDLCLAADVLITDYSSIMFDYANLARPIVIYADDYDTYRRVRGVYFDLLAEPPGAVATTEDELIRILLDRAYETPDARARLESFRRRFCEWDDGGAAERVVRRVFLGEEPAPPVPFDRRVPAPAPREAERGTSPARSELPDEVGDARAHG